MGFRLAADAVLAVHLAFIVFVVAGGLLLFRWPKLAWLHLPAAAWGAWIEIAGRICPLTTIENRLRRAAGAAGYDESFIEHYIVPVIYPSGLTRGLQIALAAVVIIVNLLVYAAFLYRRGKMRIGNAPPPS